MIIVAEPDSYSSDQYYWTLFDKEEDAISYLKATSYPLNKLKIYKAEELDIGLF